MPDTPDYGPHFRSFRNKESLTFLLKEIQRRFPNRTRTEIHEALEQSLSEIAPSLDRSRLRKRMIQILGLKE